MLVDDELGAWLRLLLSPGIGRDSARRLLASFGSAEAVFAAPAAARRALLSTTQSEALAAEPPGLDEQRRQLEAWLAGDGERRVVTLGDALYPPALLHAADPPLLL